jgi:hypothetical protein
VDFEYLAIADGAKPGQGKMLRYRLLDRGPCATEIVGLLSPEGLRELMERRR